MAQRLSPAGLLFGVLPINVLHFVGSQPILDSHDQLRTNFDVIGELRFHSGVGVDEFEYLGEDVEDGQADFLGGEGGRNEGVH